MSNVESKWLFLNNYLNYEENIYFLILFVKKTQIDCFYLIVKTLGFKHCLDEI